MIRPAHVDELDYCRSTWLAGLLRGTKCTLTRRNNTRATITRILDSQVVLVDTIPGIERAQDVVAWAAVTQLASTSVVHYVYVRKPYRQQGRARRLLIAAGVDLDRIVPYTHASSLLPSLLQRSGVRATLIPLAEVL